MAGPQDVHSIVAGIVSDSESSRKLSAYHLQTLVSDHSFARGFVQAQGVPALKQLVLEENGNALAYALGSLTRLLEMDLGWDHLTSDVIERAVQIVVTRPVINVLRNALLLLVLVVSRPFDPYRLQQPSEDEFGFKALVPLLQAHPNFLDCLVDKLASADHALCANALHLVNALMRDSVMQNSETEWPKFINRLQELGVISGVESLMRGDALQEIALPVLEFQNLMKILLARWRHILVDFEKPEHRRALKQLHVSSIPANYQSNQQDLDSWQRLGFSSDNPAADLQEARFLGLMDLSEYVRRNRDTFQKELLEQGVQPVEQRCPIARASLSITTMLYNHFEIDNMVGQDPAASTQLAKGDNPETLVQPLLLRWEAVHATALNAFVRLWKEAGAVIKDFHKIEDLTRLLIKTVLGRVDRRLSLTEVEEQLGNAPLEKVREWQLQDVSQLYEYAWGQDLRKLREQTHADALLFMREQRVKRLLQGSWFPIISSGVAPSDRSVTSANSQKPHVTAWRFVRLSNDRKYLHHASHPIKLDKELQLQELNERLDLDTISSVDSSVTRSDILINEDVFPKKTTADKHASSLGTITRLTIFGTPHGFSQTQTPGESTLLELNTSNTALASEWLDGLLMLLNQQPITADTNKFVDLLEQWSLTIRMLNLRWEDVDWERARDDKHLPVPSREGLDDNFWYNMGDGA